MITYKDILHSTTKILSDNFDCDVIVKNQEGTFDKECFYVSVVPLSSRASTCLTNEKQLMISIKYFSDDKLKNYDMADKLEGLFARNIQVKDRFLSISNIEPNFLTDEVGDMLDFLIDITYIEKIKKSVNELVDEYEKMQNLDINIKE
jgi:hypothetical protein